MKEIKLTKGKIALVDDDMFDLLSKHKWHALSSKYASFEIGGEIVRMHRLVINAKECEFVDHIDGNTFNNQRNNLRIATKSQNAMNMKNVRHTSQFKGVCWHKLAKKWMAQIKCNYKRIYLGIFKEERDAAIAYDKAAIEHFGEFARLNFIQN